MATNRSHVFAAIEVLRNKAEAAKEAIEGKENLSDNDDERILAYESFLEALENITDELEDALEGLV